MRTVVTRPMGKGEVSTRLTQALDEAYLRVLRALRGDPRAGSRPFRIGGAVRRARAGAGHLAAGAAPDPGLAAPHARTGRATRWPRPTHLQPIRNYLRFLGPARRRTTSPPSWIPR